MYTQVFKTKSLCLRARAFEYEKKRKEGWNFEREAIPRSRDNVGRKLEEESRERERGIFEKRILIFTEQQRGRTI